MPTNGIMELSYRSYTNTVLVVRRLEASILI
jgi:hypothetical protein